MTRRPATNTSATASAHWQPASPADRDKMFGGLAFLVGGNMAIPGRTEIPRSAHRWSSSASTSSGPGSWRTFGITAATRRGGYTVMCLWRGRMRCVEFAEPGRHVAVKQEKARREAPPRPRSESRRRTALVAVRFLPQERDTLARSARSRGVTLSEFIRTSAMRTAGTPAPDVGSQ
jgi:hypothetical protein